MILVLLLLCINNTCIFFNQVYVIVFPFFREINFLYMYTKLMSIRKKKCQ